MVGYMYYTSMPDYYEPILTRLYNRDTDIIEEINYMTESRDWRITVVIALQNERNVIKNMITRLQEIPFNHEDRNKK